MFPSNESWVMFLAFFSCQISMAKTAGPTLELRHRGDAGQLYDSIYEQIFTLDPDTQIFPGHEYNGNLGEIDEWSSGVKRVKRWTKWWMFGKKMFLNIDYVIEEIMFKLLSSLNPCWLFWWSQSLDDGLRSRERSRLSGCWDSRRLQVNRGWGNQFFLVSWRSYIAFLKQILRNNMFELYICIYIYHRLTSCWNNGKKEIGPSVPIVWDDAMMMHRKASSYFLPFNLMLI